MGLRLGRDPLCVVQLSAGNGDAHVVQLRRPAYDAPNLKRLLADPSVLKLFHFGRFDIAMFALHLGVVAGPGLLHQDRLQAGPHLHRPPRPEGPDARTAGLGHVQGPAVLRLGRTALSQARSTTPPPTYCTFMRSRIGWTRCWRVRGATDWPRPVSTSSRGGPGSTLPAGRTSMSSPTAEHPYHPAFDRDIERRLRELRRWRGHSSQIKRLRWGLPVAMAALLAVLLGWAAFTTLIEPAGLAAEFSHGHPHDQPALLRP